MNRNNLNSSEWLRKFEFSSFIVPKDQM